MRSTFTFESPTQVDVLSSCPAGNALSPLLSNRSLILVSNNKESLFPSPGRTGSAMYRYIHMYESVSKEAELRDTLICCTVPYLMRARIKDEQRWACMDVPKPRKLRLQLQFSRIRKIRNSDNSHGRTCAAFAERPLTYTRSK